MKLNGDIPVGLVEDLYYRLETNGIYIEDFIVDTNEGYINIITNIPLDNTDILEPIFNDNLWNDVRYYVDDIVDKNLLEQARDLLRNERGIVSPAVAIGISSAATTALASNSASTAVELTTSQTIGAFGLIGFIGLIAIGLMLASSRYY